jgi:hypothetical protein
MTFSCTENLIRGEVMTESKTDFTHFDVLDIRVGRILSVEESRKRLGIEQNIKNLSKNPM